MKDFPSTTRRFRIVARVLSLTIAAVLLESVADGFLHPDPQAVAERRDRLAAQADEATRSRALAEGAIQSAAAIEVAERP